MSFWMHPQPFSVLPQPAERNVQQVQATEPLEPAEKRAARSGHLLDASAAIFRLPHPAVRNVQQVQATEPLVLVQL